MDVARDEPSRTHRAEDGAGEAAFTLVEVLVSFAIAAVATIMVLQIAGTTAFGVRRIETLRIAADEAEGVALRRIADGPLRPGLLQGAFSDGSPWTLGISDVRSAPGPGRAPPLWLLEVTRPGGGGEPVYATLVPGKVE